MALGDSVAELREITPGELTPVAPAAGSPPILTDIWHKAAISCSFSPLSCEARIVCGTDSLAETRTKSESSVGIL